MGKYGILEKPKGSRGILREVLEVLGGGFFLEGGF